MSIPLVSAGYEGSIDETQWAAIADSLGSDPYALGAASLSLSPVGGFRQVTVTAGSHYAHGVLATLEAAALLDVPEPAAAAWHLLVARRDWTHVDDDDPDVGGLTSLELLEASVQVELEVPPAEFLDTLADEPGVLVDTPLWWVGATAATTSLMLSDLRATARFAASVLGVQQVVLAGVAGQGTVDLGEAGHIVCLRLSGAGRFRLYRTAAARAQDADRLASTPYQGLPGGALIIDSSADAGGGDDQEMTPPFAYALGEQAYYYTVDGGPLTVTIFHRRG